MGASHPEGAAAGNPTGDSHGSFLQPTRVYLSASAAAALLLSLATVFYHFEEGWSWVDAIYFSTIAITSVGFGDLTPTTDTSKIVTVLYIFSGISLIAVVLHERMKRRAARHERHYAKRHGR